VPEQDSTEREARRLTLLETVGLTSEPEGRFSELVELAAFVCHTPMAALTVIEADTAWFKATVGFESDPTGRAALPCDTVVTSTRPVLVPDIADDRRFAENPAIKATGARFYAGFPLLIDGCALGTVCVLDRRPRRMLSDELHALRVIADQAANQLRIDRLEALLRDAS
jgi:GAF domain-containing protein